MVCGAAVIDRKIRKENMPLLYATILQWQKFSLLSTVCVTTDMAERQIRFLMHREVVRCQYARVSGFCRERRGSLMRICPMTRNLWAGILVLFARFNNHRLIDLTR